MSSPFKNKLFWPKPVEKRKKSKEKIPTVATSEEWIQYHQKKEKEKFQKQQEIEERKKKRIEACFGKVKVEGSRAF